MPGKADVARLSPVVLIGTWRYHFGVPDNAAAFVSFTLSVLASCFVGCWSCPVSAAHRALEDWSAVTGVFAALALLLPYTRELAYEVCMLWVLPGLVIAALAVCVPVPRSEPAKPRKAKKAKAEQKPAPAPKVEKREKPKVASRKVEGVQPGKMSSDPELARWLGQVRDLCQDAFGEAEMKSGWRLTIFVDPAPEGDVQGFVLYRIRPHLGCLSIGKVVVSKQCRGLGLGTRLMKWCKDLGRKEGLQCVVLSALKEAVPFYRRLGYRAVNANAVNAGTEDDEDLVPGQVYMEQKLRRAK